MRAPAYLAIAVLCTVANAQAPVEERGVAPNLSLGAQQRVEFARRAAERADSELKDAERNVRRGESSLESAQWQYENAKAKLEQARKNLDGARSKASEAHASYERESAQFDRQRRGAP